MRETATPLFNGFSGTHRDPKRRAKGVQL